MNAPIYDNSRQNSRDDFDFNILYFGNGGWTDGGGKITATTKKFKALQLSILDTYIGSQVSSSRAGVNALLSISCILYNRKLFAQQNLALSH